MIKNTRTSAKTIDAWLNNGTMTNITRWKGEDISNLISQEKGLYRFVYSRDLELGTKLWQVYMGFTSHKLYGCHDRGVGRYIDGDSAYLEWKRCQNGEKRWKDMTVAEIPTYNLKT